MKTLNIEVWGKEYEVVIKVGKNGLFESGYAKNAGKIDKDSKTAEVINKALKGE